MQNTTKNKSGMPVWVKVLMILVSCGIVWEFAKGPEQGVKDANTLLDKGAKEKDRKEEKLHRYTIMADSLLSIEEDTTGIKYLDSALNINPTQFILWRKRAEYFAKAKDYETAIQAYSEVIMLPNTNNLDRYNAYLELAKLYVEEEGLANRILCLQAAIKSTSDNELKAEAQKRYDKANPETKTYIGRRSRCCDGTSSSATGRGACSHHGGVCGTEPIYRYGRKWKVTGSTFKKQAQNYRPLPPKL